jgi:hypothetical protein
MHESATQRYLIRIIDHSLLAFVGAIIAHYEDVLVKGNLSRYTFFYF